MARLTCSLALIVLFSLVASDPRTRTAAAAAASDPHAYFDALVARSDHWKSYSLRSQAQLTYKNDGGYSTLATTSIPNTLWINYDYEGDTDPNKQDAAKVVIPDLGFASSSVRSGVLLPLNTVDGNTYLFTWDTFWTSSYLNSGLTNHKAFNFMSGGRSLGQIWLETQTNYNGGFAAGFNPATDVGAITERFYYLSGPNVTQNGGDPLLPLANPTLIIKPNTWVRFWVQYQQIAGGFDLMSMWVADENVNPIQIYNQLQLNTRPFNGVDTIQGFLVEFNTSDDTDVRTGEREGLDFVAYVRNFVALIDVASPDSLLLRPSPTAPLPPVGPVAPANLRIVR